MLRAILFDLGDTLLDFRPLDMQDILARGSRDSYEGLRAAGAKLPSLISYRRGHVRAVKLSLIWSRIRNRECNAMTVMRKRTAKMGVPDTDPFMHKIAWEWYKPVVDYSWVEPEVIATLQLFREAGLKLGIVSNTVVGGVLDRHLELVGLLDFFPVRIYSSEIGYRKPHPKIFQTALSAIGAKPHETLFVGDVVKNDIIGARRMGMTTVLRQRNSPIRRHPLANHTIRHISELVPIVLPAAEVAAARG